MLVVGLAPAAHGANRTGRLFTGDRSGDWLFRALHASGFANGPISTRRGDGLALKDAYVTAAVRCAPPDNTPLRGEFANCESFLRHELLSLTRVCVVVALGGLAFEAYIRTRRALGQPVPVPRPRFRHGARVDLGDVTLLASYHPSQQNTFTGRLKRPAFHRVFRRARESIRR